MFNRFILSESMLNPRFQKIHVDLKRKKYHFQPIIVFQLQLFIDLLAVRPAQGRA
jgi:hypothetical protein